MGTGYLKAFEEAQRKRLAKGEKSPSYRAKGDVDTNYSIAKRQNLKDDMEPSRQKATASVDKAVAEGAAKDAKEAEAKGSGVKGETPKKVEHKSDGSVAGGALSGAATGMAIGGPWGAAAGAALGGLGAASKNKKKEFAAKQAGRSNALGTYLQLIDKGMV